MIELEFRNVDFCGGRKTGSSKNVDNIKREGVNRITLTTVYSSYIHDRVQNSKPISVQET
jgi:hypothetical protein